MLSKDTEWLRVVIDTAADGVILTDAAGTVLLFNPACERLFGYRPAEVIGRNVEMLMPASFREERDDDPAGGHRSDERKLSGFGREATGRRKDGTGFPVELSVGETSRAGQPLYAAIIHDITERRQAEKQRQSLIEQLIASNEERGHFSYVASHDMQEHLRMVLSFGSLLSEEYGPQLDDKARQYISLSLHAAKQMRELVDDLVEYGRLGGAMDRAGPFDAEAEMELVLEGLEESIHDTGAQIAVDRLPTLCGNPVRFRRLMQNLVGNAIKYVPPRTRPLIRVTVQEEGEFWRFCVKDNGIGIDPAYFRKIFEPFQRLHAKAQFFGSGLGLTICEKIVAGFGGRIWVESAPGAGSSFLFMVGKKAASGRDAP